MSLANGARRLGEEARGAQRVVLIGRTWAGSDDTDLSGQRDRIGVVRITRPFSLLVLAAVVLGIGPVGASAAGGPAIPGGTYGGHGVTGPPQTPAAEYRYVAIWNRSGTSVARIATDGGAVRQSWSYEKPWTPPAVTLFGDAGGLSADGETLVLVDANYRPRPRETQLRILATRRLKTREVLTLDGAFSFDAISPDGRLLYLVQYPDPRDPLDYRVRGYDLAEHEFLPGRIVDPSEPDEQMTGQPIDRKTSPDGRWAYTLYGGGEEPFIHALDTAGATAVCVDLDGLDPKRLFDDGLSVDPVSGEIAVISLRTGDPVALVDPETFEVTEPANEPPANEGGGFAWIAGAAAALVLLALSFWMLRRRRRRGSVDQAALEQLVRTEGEGKEPVH